MLSMEEKQVREGEGTRIQLQLLILLHLVS